MKTLKTLYHLVHQYPRLFKGKLPRVPSDLPHGWFGLVDEALASIDALLTDAQAERVQVVQIKEKFGTLRIALDRDRELIGHGEFDVPIYRPDEEMAQVLSQARTFTVSAANKSACTCAACGAHGRMRNPGTGDEAWWLTLCNACNRIPRAELEIYP